MVEVIDHYLLLNLLLFFYVAVCLNQKEGIVNSLAVSFYRSSWYDNRLIIYLQMVFTLGCNGALRWNDGSGYEF